MRFTGQSALVTGAGGGMGLAIANQLINRGINVCLADLKPRPEDIASGPGRATYVRADLSTEDGIDMTVSAVLSENGRLDYLANSVGALLFHEDRSAVETDMAIWDKVMSVNLRTTVLLAKRVIPEMRRRSFGAMVHFSSIDALRGDRQPQDAYGAAKAALIRLSKSLAVQFAAHGIRSNVILPGPCLTPMQNRWEGDADAQSRVAAGVPLKRLGSAEDQANACLFLLSDNAAFITGTELVVDGGITALP